jgi:hypothetical protein
VPGIYLTITKSSTSTSTELVVSSNQPVEPPATENVRAVFAAFTLNVNTVAVLTLFADMRIPISENVPAVFIFIC